MAILDGPLCSVADMLQGFGWAVVQCDRHVTGFWMGRRAVWQICYRVLDGPSCSVADMLQGFGWAVVQCDRHVTGFWMGHRAVWQTCYRVLDGPSCSVADMLQGFGWAVVQCGRYVTGFCNNLPSLVSTVNMKQQLPTIVDTFKRHGVTSRKTVALIGK